MCLHFNLTLSLLLVFALTLVFACRRFAIAFLCYLFIPDILPMYP
jgi:hypothetical protein